MSTDAYAVVVRYTEKVQARAEALGAYNVFPGERRRALYEQAAMEIFPPDYQWTVWETVEGKCGVIVTQIGGLD